MSDWNMVRPQVAVFDLGKVLLDFDYGLALQRLGGDRIQDPARSAETLMASDVFNAFERGELDEHAFYEALQAQWGFGDSFEVFRERYGDIFSEIDLMIEACRRIRAAGVPVWILSNTNALAVGWIRERYPFFHEFDGYVCSHETHSMKPDAKIYEVLEAAVGVSGDRLLYVDDRLENVVAAIRRGWRVIHHVDPAVSSSLMLAAFGIDE